MNRHLRVRLLLPLLSVFCWQVRGGEPASRAQRGDRRAATATSDQTARGKQERDNRNPLAGNEQAAREGGVLFRQLCTACHGARGRGGKGPDLTDTVALHGSSDAEMFRVIQRGVSGTTMKQLGESISEAQIWKIITFVRTLARSAGDPGWRPYMPGDPVAGKKLFFDEKSEAACVTCLAVDGVGGKIGPALSRIAAQRSPEYLMESLLRPSADIDPSYEGVTVITRRGRMITGVRINEDNFSIQLRDQQTGRLHSFFKRELEAVRKQDKSLMPDNLAEQLTIKELHDLFAYLTTLDGRSSSAPGVAGTARHGAGAAVGNRRPNHAKPPPP